MSYNPMGLQGSSYGYCQELDYFKRGLGCSTVEFIIDSGHSSLDFRSAVNV
jgi:hypothetical protein